MRIILRSHNPFARMSHLVIYWHFIIFFVLLALPFIHFVHTGLPASHEWLRRANRHLRTQRPNLHREKLTEARLMHYLCEDLRLATVSELFCVGWCSDVYQWFVTSLENLVN
jgi:hypothetical protein